MDEYVIASAELAERAELVARRLSLMASPSRLMIRCRLAEGEASVGALQGGVSEVVEIRGWRNLRVT